MASFDLQIVNERAVQVRSACEIMTTELVNERMVQVRSACEIMDLEPINERSDLKLIKTKKGGCDIM